MKLLIIWLTVSGCALTQRQPEQFFYKNNDVYHVSSKQDTTLLNWSDLKVLRIDSLQNKYLELNAEK